MIGSDGEKYDEKTAEAFGESWRHWDNSPGCQLTPDIPLPKSEMWGLWMLELKNRPNFDGLIPKVLRRKHLPGIFIKTGIFVKITSKLYYFVQNFVIFNVM